jgi:acyl-CoA reductase-like NAD-dependent aldehyde dehydrogenase
LRRWLASEVIKLKVGEGTEVGVMQGPLINEAALAKVEAHVKDAVAASTIPAAVGSTSRRCSPMLPPR